MFDNRYFTLNFVVIDLYDVQRIDYRLMLGKTLYNSVIIRNDIFQ